MTSSKTECISFLESRTKESVRRSNAIRTRILIVTVAAFLTCLPLFSQSLNVGRILGTVSDQTGGALVGATVTVIDTQRGISRMLSTDEAGQYSAPNLQPGTYTVRAEYKGFTAVQRENIGLEVGKEIRVDFSLQPGAQTQTITVTEELPIVETTNAVLGGTLSNQMINDIPLNGRNFENLLSLRPGVTLYPGGGARTQSTDGIRAEDQVYVFDGLNNTEPYTGYSIVNQVNLAGDTGTMMSIDAIQEFNTEENPKAESGWKPGAVVNVGIKSGTNSIHGTAFAFGRDTGFDARNYFNILPQPKTPVALEQFGGTVGGPIKKNKLFYFLDYEDQRYSVGSSFNIVAPITAAVGTASTSLQAACLAALGAGPVSANSAKLAGVSASCVPLSNYPGLFPINNGPTTAYTNNNTSGQQSDNGLAKINYHINDHNELSGTYFFGRGVGTYNDAPNEVQPLWLSVGTMQAQVGSGSWTWTPNSNWTNELRSGYDRFFRSFLSADAHQNPQDFIFDGSNYSLNTGVTNPLFYGFPLIRFNSFSSSLFRFGGNWPKVIGPNGVFQAVDHVSYLHGAHSFKFGGEILYDQDHSQITANAKGQIRFASLQSFFTGTTANNSQILIGDPTRNVHDEGFAVFFQDDWRVKPRLIVNLGIRWEMATVPVEANNLFGNFSPTQGLEQVGLQIKSPFNGDHDNFAPRLGLAWDVFGNGKTVVRAGGAVMYEELTELQVFLGLGNTLGLGTVPTGAIINAAGDTSGGNIVFAPVIFGNGKLNWNGSSVGGSSIFPTGTLNCYLSPCTVMSVDPNLRTPYITSWSLDVQHAITNNLSLTVGYVGNHGTKALGLTDINQAPIGSGYAAGCASASACEQAARPFAAEFPYLANIAHLSNLYDSNYNSLQASLTMRPTHGLSLTAGYTYAHALDDESENFGGAGIPIDSSHPQQQLYGDGDFDLRHRLTLTTNYMIPGKKSPGQLLEGWQINSVVTLQTGLPWYAQDDTNDLSGTGEVGNTGSNLERWDFFGNPKNFTSNQNPFPFCTGTASGVTNCQAPTASGFLSGSQATADWNNCMTHAATLPMGPNGQTGTQSLISFGCYVSTNGNSILIPPALGTLGTEGRDIFRDSGFKGWDVSVMKNWKFERLTAQFRAEFFNVLNHPNFANPLGGPNGYANNNLSGGYGMGCGCATPDQAGTNPVLGVGGARDIQLGLKLLF